MFMLGGAVSFATVQVAGTGDDGILASSRSGRCVVARAVWNGVVLADSSEFIMVENNFYFPPESVRFDLLQEHTGYHTECPWKGTASYYNVVVDGQTRADGAWSYLDPKERARNITGYVAFWKGVRIEA
jgi:uncharacterized protein (DUF427 family)